MPGNAIKNFFKRSKNKFAGAGTGHKLNESDSDKAAAASSSGPRRHKDAYVPPNRSALTPEARAAADAAMARFQRTDDPRTFNTSIAAIRMQVKRELEAERLAKEQLASGGAASTSASSSAMAAAAPAAAADKLAVQGVFFR